MGLSLQATRSAVLGSVFSGSVLALALTACAPQTPTAAPGSSASPAGGAASSSGGVSLNGAGATAPNPLYQRWFSEYNKKTGVQISYQSVGSGAGVKQFLSQTVDFGASDSALKDEEKKEYPPQRGAKAIQVPTTGLFIVMAYNLDGVDNLKLTREAYCGIVDGSIKTWNDPKIATANAGVNLPADPIAFVHRSDGSGTTSIFTKHLEKACPNWKAGAGKTVEWPSGTGAKGNEGVTAQIQQTKGAVGYTEFSYAKENKLKMATLQNKAGEFIVPAPVAAAKALEGVSLPEDFALSVPDPEGKEAYPIISLTWILLYEQYPDKTKADALKAMVKWALSDGKPFTEELGYLPLPADVVTKVNTALDAIK